MRSMKYHRSMNLITESEHVEKEIKDIDEDRNGSLEQDDVKDEFEKNS